VDKSAAGIKLLGYAKSRCHPDFGYLPPRQLIVGSILFTRAVVGVSDWVADTAMNDTKQYRAALVCAKAVYALVWSARTRWRMASR
jgi:hypothetical protein